MSSIRINQLKTYYTTVWFFIHSRSGKTDMKDIQVLDWSGKVMSKKGNWERNLIQVAFCNKIVMSL